MNKKVLIGLVGAVVVVAGLYALKVQRDAAKWRSAEEFVKGEDKFVKDGNVTTIRFVSVMDGALDRVQAALWNVENSAGTVANVKLSKLIKQEGNTKTLEMHLQASNLPLQRYTMQFTLHPKEHRIAFKTTESQFQDMEGSYQLEASPDGKRTRITYNSTARDKVAVPFPTSVLESANRETFVNTVRGVKKQLQSPAAG